MMEYWWPFLDGWRNFVYETKIKEHHVCIFENHGKSTIHDHIFPFHMSACRIVFSIILCILFATATLPAIKKFF
ncbi:hypothetical protein SUGI_0698760 [Cryptomeria japonica]|nr:hypothetical protein SUGI_0698760 [Cryptomeria japonica]